MSERISTGSPGLDEVMHGGLLANTITVIMGAPGTGKSILAEQIAFHNATSHAPSLYLTTLSEPLEKFITHGQLYSFFDPAKVGESVLYEDLGLMVRQSGIEKLPEIVSDLFIRFRPGCVVIDSFKALNELLGSEGQRRTIIYDLANALSAYKCTSLLVGEYSDSMTTVLPEFAIADGVIQLVKHSTNVREQRFARVEKFRGSDSVPGFHAFSITNKGIEMFPRLLTPRISPTYTPRAERVSSGIETLDPLLSEGVWRGSATLVAGPTGVGKTLLALHFIRDGALKGEPSLFLAFQENPEQLARIMLGFGWEPSKLIGSKNFELMYRSPVELQLDQVASELFGLVRQGKVTRVAIDAIGDLERSSIDRQRFADFMYALLQWFAVENVTCMITCELPELFEAHRVTEHEISNLCDNLVLLGYTAGAELKRTLKIIKTRGSAHNSRQHFLEIGDQGAVVKKAT